VSYAHKKQKAIIIDCNGLCHREYHSLRNIGLNYSGLKTDIIFGFFRELKYFVKTMHCNKFIFAWDSVRNFRINKYPEYKLKRRTQKEEKSDEEKELERIIFDQFDELRIDILPFLGFQNIFIQTGMEADDIIASVVMNNYEDYNLTVVSGDEDLLQLLDYCKIYRPIKKEYVSRETFINKYGIEPIDWVKVKAIAGCVSDEVKGIDGVGEKTAIRYLLGELPNTHKTYQKIISQEGQEIYNRNLPIVKLPFEGTHRFIIANDRLNIYSFRKVFEKYGFFSFLKDEDFNFWCKSFQLL